MVVGEVMNKNIQTIGPDASIIEAASKMRDGDFGVMPVMDGQNLVGMLTDRDIAIRVVAEGKDLQQCTVEDVMTPEILTCNEDDDLEEIAQMMADKQVRRLPVLDMNKKLVGIVSVGDLAIMDQDQAGEALGGISEQRHDEPGAQLHQ
jgi:CBS domain-containing protein